MEFIEPLKMETWIIGVLSGTPEIFTALAMMVITGMAAYFRMNGLGLFFIIIVFLLMFSGAIPLTLITFIAIFGGLLGGYILSNVFNR